MKLENLPERVFFILHEIDMGNPRIFGPYLNLTEAKIRVKELGKDSEFKSFTIVEMETKMSGQFHYQVDSL